MPTEEQAVSQFGEFEIVIVSKGGVEVTTDFEASYKYYYEYQEFRPFVVDVRFRGQPAAAWQLTRPWYAFWRKTYGLEEALREARLWVERQAGLTAKQQDRVQAIVDDYRLRDAAIRELDPEFPFRQLEQEVNNE